MTRRLACAAIFLAGMAAPAQAAIVYLKAGGQIEGSILRRTPDYVEVLTGGTTVRIGADKISRIEEHAPEQAVLAPPPPIYRHTVSPDIGLDVPLSKVNFNGIGGGSGNNGDVGPLVGIQYLYGLDARWSIGLDFNYFYRDATDSQGLLPNAEASVSGNDVILLALLKYSLLDRGRARPYLAAGIGPGLTSTTIDATPNPGFVWSNTNTAETRRLVDDSAWTWASSLRLGIDFPMRSEVFGVEIGWTRLGSTSLSATGAGQALGLGGVSAALDALTIAGRWGWRF